MIVVLRFAPLGLASLLFFGYPIGGVSGAKKNMGSFAASAVALLLLGPTSAFAYMDPGSGSMMLQLLLGGVGGAAVVLRLYWHRLRAFFGRGPAAETQVSERSATASESRGSDSHP